MSDTRKVLVTVTRTYTKQIQLEADVPNDVEDVQEWLNDELCERIGYAMDDAILYDDEDELNYEYQDE
jgi:hypothetical protein